MKRAVTFVCFAASCFGCTSSEGDVFVSRDRSPTGGTEDCTGSIFCTGFELPSRQLDAVGTGSVEIVAEPVHAGSAALRVSTASPDDWARLLVPLDGLSAIGVRAWVMLDAAVTPLGPSEVYVLIALHPSPDASAGGVNKVSIDIESGYQLELVETLGPDKKHSESSMTPGKWHCLQLEVRGEAGAEQATVSFDGTPRATTTATPSVVSPGGFQSLLVGIEYATGITPITLYYDDVSVSDTAPTCAD